MKHTMHIGFEWDSFSDRQIDDKMKELEASIQCYFHLDDQHAMQMMINYITLYQTKLMRAEEKAKAQPVEIYDFNQHLPAAPSQPAIPSALDRIFNESKDELIRKLKAIKQVAPAPVQIAKATRKRHKSKQLVEVQI